MNITSWTKPVAAAKAVQILPKGDEMDLHMQMLRTMTLSPIVQVVLKKGL